MKRGFIFILIFLISISFVYASVQVGDPDDSDEGVDIVIPEADINYSIQNVSMADFWDSLDTPADISAGDLTDDNTYVQIIGDTMTGDLITQNLTATNGTFLGDLLAKNITLLEGGILQIGSRSATPTTSIIRFGDGDFVSISESTDDDLTIKATEIIFESLGIVTFDLAGEDIGLSSISANVVLWGTGSGVIEMDFEALNLETRGSIRLKADNTELLWGESADAGCYYNASDFICNPKRVGSGKQYIYGGLVVNETLFTNEINTPGEIILTNGAETLTISRTGNSVFSQNEGNFIFKNTNAESTDLKISPIAGQRGSIIVDETTIVRFDRTDGYIDTGQVGAYNQNFFRNSAEGNTAFVRIYGRPTGLAEKYGQFQISDYNGEEWYNISTDSTGILLDSDVAITGTIINDAIYCESSELVDQEFAIVGMRYRLNISNVDEGNGIGMTTGTNGTNVTIQIPGVYHMVAQPQVKAGAGDAGDFHMWIEKSSGGGFADVPDSNIELKLSSLEEDVIVLATTLKLNTGDVLRFVVSVSDNGILLHAQTPAGEPTIPSIIFTMYRVGS